MISSEKLFFDAPFINIFILWKVMFRSGDIELIIILNHSINFEGCGVMMNYSTRRRVHF